MGFQSPLLPLERLRASLERLAWLRLRTIHTQIAAASTRLRNLEEEIRGIRASTSERLREGMTSEQLALDSVAALEFERRGVWRLLEQLAVQRRTAEQDFMRCRRERQIVENAVALERAAYEEERARKQQAAVDDSVLQRISRERQDTAGDKG